MASVHMHCPERFWYPQISHLKVVIDSISEFWLRNLVSGRLLLQDATLCARVALAKCQVDLSRRRVRAKRHNSRLAFIQQPFGSPSAMDFLPGPHSGLVLIPFA
jgi:hypothetical protein